MCPLGAAAAWSPGPLGGPRLVDRDPLPCPPPFVPGDAAAPRGASRAVLQLFQQRQHEARDVASAVRSLNSLHSGPAVRGPEPSSSAKLSAAQERLRAHVRSSVQALGRPRST